MNKARLRQLHSYFAPLIILPVLLTLLTGTFFQMVAITGNSENFLWLLEWHRGKFGRINLEMIYPFFNAFGLLVLAITGITMWFQTQKRNSQTRKSKLK